MGRLLRGRRLAILSLLVALACAVVIVVFDIHDELRATRMQGRGISDHAMARLYALRYTVRISAAFFIAAFVARPLNDLLHASFTRWLVKNRRYIGLSCAAFLLQHLWLLPALQLERPMFQTWWAKGTLIPALIALSLATALTVTSFNTAQRSWRYWKPLHVAGIYAMWFWYTKSFFDEWTHPTNGRPYHLVFLVALIAALAIRLAARLRAIVRERVRP
jgi:methionine sulfoxide reductase heme-binding subunit